MIALTSPYLWYTTRATGFVALILLTLVVALGTFVATRVGGTLVGRFELNELHRSVSIIAVVFLAIHITSTVIDSYVPTGWISIFLPMTSSYKRLAVGLGSVAFDLVLAVWISSLLKLRIRNSTWRFIHWFSWLAFVTAVVHTLMTGTDSRRTFGLVTVVVCSGAVVGAALWRYLGRPARAAGRTALSPLAPISHEPVPVRPRVDTPPVAAPPRGERPFPTVPRDDPKRGRR